MGKKRVKSHTLPSSPTHSLSSSSSSEFEFRISLSPRKSSATADELFYKGQLLPLSLSPRLSLVRSLLASASSSARDSSGSSADSHSSFTVDCDSSRPSSAEAGDDDDEFLLGGGNEKNTQVIKKKFSLSRFSSVFRKDNSQGPKVTRGDATELSSVKRMSSTAKEVICKYFKKVKPLYEKISHKQQQKMSTTTTIRAMSSSDLSLPLKTDIEWTKETDTCTQNSKNNSTGGSLSHSFSGNLKYPRKRNYGSSCPSSMRSSPSHSGVLYGKKFPNSNNSRSTCYSVDTSSSMDELQSAIQGAIAHCKNSMVQDKCMSSNEI